jgi:hypothetical protein
VKIGKWYVVIGRAGGLCFGIGTPPAEALALIDRSRKHSGV